ncbi:ATP-binding cassette domain-containing protein [Secundilactobacillus kimchicus]|uniref:ABC transporter, ATP-binding protein n=1 Tax=Secundilactobacillus kimchicus JCM 15530 TaxID=1302272 RepID=A0A0R1HLD5_9LACO|nr:ATP-binding cassette domain-containing protein [Secundilactobacillus kimchicus]KRK47112.1 ABC transporter, ATP-binding protein [Secundilactobacillus kimchicus JCM 15530]MBT9672522.1 ATP-binding cassette domain-containing protein [Secundilactobacillus kimchicus]
MSEILTISNLNKSFGSKKVLHDVSLTVETGHIVGLVGPNGAGKSTIMKTILGLINYQSGDIKINGQVVSPTSHQALSKVGALIEYPGLYPFLSGWDHLRLFADGDNRLEHMQDIVSKLKMDGYIKQKAKGYSLGMKQKLGIAMALLNDPDLVILDEPMNGLDPQATKDLRDLILDEAKDGKTFLISSHILSELEKLAQDLLIIDHGSIIRQTTMSELLASGGSFIDLQTSDDQAARQALQAAGFELTNDASLRVVLTDSDDNAMTNVLGTLNNAGLTVKDVKHEEGSLESSLLDLLAHDQDQVKE